MKWILLSLFFVIFFINLSFSFEINEEDYLIEEIDFITSIQGSTKYTQSILKSAATISVVQPLELKFFYYPDLKTLFQFCPGLYIVEDGSFWSIGNRGIQIPGSVNSRTLVLTDGYQSNDFVYGYPLDIPTSFIHGIEIVHGYSNVYFGSNSLLATINIIPNFRYYSNDYYKEKFFRKYSYLNFLEGKINTTNGFMFNSKFGKYNSSVGLNLTNYKGRKIFYPGRKEISDFFEYNPNYGLGIDYVAYNTDRSYSNFYYFSLYNRDEKLYFSGYSTRVHFPAAIYVFRLNSPYFFSYQQNRLAFYERKIQIDNNTQLVSKISYQKFSRTVNFIYEDLMANLLSYPSLMENDNLSSEIISFENNLYIKSNRYDLLVGFDVKRANLKLWNILASSPERSPIIEIFQYASDMRRKFWLYSFYFHLDYYIREDLLFALGGRYDNYSNFYKDFLSISRDGTRLYYKDISVKPVFIPKFGIIKLLNNEKSIKLLYSQNVRFPTFFEITRNAYWNSLVFEPITLMAEKHKTLELVYYYEKKKNKNFKTFTLSLYSTNISDLINEYPVLVDLNSNGIPDEEDANVIVYRSLAKLNILGIFCDYTYQKSNREFFRFSFSYSNARVINTVPYVLEYLPNSPKLVVLAKYGRKLGDNFSVGLEIKYTSETLPDNYRMLSVWVGDLWAQGADQGIFQPPQTIKPFLLTNITFNYYFDEKNYITFHVNNVFNEKYEYPISLINSRPIYSYPGLKRNFYIGVNYTFYTR